MTAIDLRQSAGTTADYELVRAIIDAVQADYPVSAEELRSIDEARHRLGFISARWFARLGDEPVGYTAYGHMVTAVDGDVFTIGLRVVPAETGRGVGRALHAKMLAAASQAGITRVLAFVDERQTRGIRFADAAGYRNVGRAWESTVDPQAFDPTGFRSVLQGVAASGVEFATLADLKKRFPDWVERLYELYGVLESGIPFPVAERPNPFEVFRAEVIDSDLAMPEAFLIAVKDDVWVGLTEFRRVEGEPTWLAQELTGVAPSHRRLGIATALKVTGLTWAGERGYHRIRTWNDSRNEGMLAVNNRLGLSRSHAIVQYLLELDG